MHLIVFFHCSTMNVSILISISLFSMNVWCPYRQLIPTFRRILAIYQLISGSSTFLPQSGPDVVQQTGSYSEALKAVFAHSITTSLYTQTHTNSLMLWVSKKKCTTFYVGNTNDMVKIVHFCVFRFGWNPQNPLWNKSEVSEPKYQLKCHLIRLWMWADSVFSCLQDQLMHYSDCRWSSFLQTLVSYMRSTQGQWL